MPARNEASALPALLGSLGPDLADVVVVDDASSDATARVALDVGARVILAGALPDGWAGKPWACQRGVAVTSSELIVFVDADVTFGPAGLAAVMAEYERCGGLVSVQPWHACERWPESLSALFNVVALMGVGAFDPLNRAPTGAFGPVLACARETYLAAGGHGAVRSEVVEDVALARRFRDIGAPVTCRLGGDHVRFRMYPGGFAELVEGWTKNFARGAAQATRPTILALITLWLSALASIVVGGTALAGHVRLGWGYPVSYVAFAAQLWWMLRLAGRFKWWAWALWPVPLATFVLVFVRSILVVLTGRPVRWKGRKIISAR